MNWSFLGMKLQFASEKTFQNCPIRSIHFGRCKKRDREFMINIYCCPLKTFNQLLLSFEKKHPRSVSRNDSSLGPKLVGVKRKSCSERPERCTSRAKRAACDAHSERKLWSSQAGSALDFLLLFGQAKRRVLAAMTMAALT